jgi:hypothetical protein
MATESIYQVFNSAAPGAAAPVAQPTGTAIRTLLQIAVPSTRQFTVIEWGISFDGASAATPVKCELLTCSGAATMTTALSAADVVSLSDPNGPASLTTFSTALTAFASAAVTEGTLTAVRLLDGQLLPPNAPYIKQFPLGREPLAPASSFIRVRVTAAATVNAVCYVVWGE